MAVSTVMKVRRDGEIKLTTGGGSPVNFVVSYEDGNFSASGLAANEARTVIRDRGTIVGLRKGDDEVPTLSFSVHMAEFSNQGADTILDIVNGTASGSALTSIGGSGYEQFLLRVTMTCEGTDHGDNADAVVIFENVLFTADFSEGDPNVLNFQGEIYGSISRGGQS